MKPGKAEATYEHGLLRAVGTTVRWTNKHNAAHTVTSGEAAFDSGNLAQGQSFSFKFTQAGTYDYACRIRPNMTATITVQ